MATKPKRALVEAESGNVFLVDVPFASSGKDRVHKLGMLAHLQTKYSQPSVVIEAMAYVCVCVVERALEGHA